jgi:hypothetical protein
MRTTVTVKHYDQYDVTFELVTRIDTAKDMLEISDACNTEQETEGRFDALRAKLENYLEPLHINWDIRPEFYPGPSDVIFILKGLINGRSECEVSDADMRGELITGTVLREIAMHFDFNSYSLRLSEDSSNREKLRKLQVFDY